MSGEGEDNAGPVGAAAALRTSLMLQAQPALWRGAIDWEARDDGAVRPWRLRHDHARLAFAPELLYVATMASGVRAELVTDGDLLELDLTLEHNEPASLDVLIDGQLHARRQLSPGRQLATFELMPGRRHIEVWLPQAGHIWLYDASVDGTAAEPKTEPAVRWATYGSSITHGLSAVGPSQTWPAVTARLLGWDVTNLGFSGQCHLDPIVARTIATMNVDVVSLCLGINVCGSASMSMRTFAPQAADLILRVRAAHPSAVLAVISPIFCEARESTPNATGLTLQMIRQCLADVVDVLSERDGRLTLIDGLTVLGPEDADRLPDGLHPDTEGFELMGQRLARQLDSLGVGAPQS